VDDDGVLDVGVVGDVDGYAFVASYGGEGSDEDVGADVDVAHDDCGRWVGRTWGSHFGVVLPWRQLEAGCCWW